MTVLFMLHAEPILRIEEWRSTYMPQAGMRIKIEIDKKLSYFVVTQLEMGIAFSTTQPHDPAPVSPSGYSESLLVHLRRETNLDR